MCIRDSGYSDRNCTDTVLLICAFLSLREKTACKNIFRRIFSRYYVKDSGHRSFTVFNFGYRQRYNDSYEHRAPKNGRNKRRYAYCGCNYSAELYDAYNGAFRRYKPVSYTHLAFWLQPITTVFLFCHRTRKSILVLFFKRYSSNARLKYGDVHLLFIKYSFLFIIVITSVYIVQYNY